MLVDATRAASTFADVAKGKSREGWQWDDTKRLRVLWDARKPASVSQDDFGAQYEIGTQGMVSQYLQGTRTLNYEAAAKFSKGLKCSLSDISPTLAERVRSMILPVLGDNKPTDRRFEPLTPDDDDLLQIYRRLRELGRGELLLKTAQLQLEDALAGRTGAEIVPIMRRRRRKNR